MPNTLYLNLVLCVNPMQCLIGHCYSLYFVQVKSIELNLEKKQSLLLLYTSTSILSDYC